MASSNSSYLTRRLARSVLREANKNPNLSFKTGNAQWRGTVIEQFRKNKNEQDPEKLNTLKQIGETFLCMVKNMREHYNLISIHYKLADPRKSVEMASKRVGLGVPEWPEVHEERLAREAEQKQLMEEHKVFAAHVEQVKAMPMDQIKDLLGSEIKNAPVKKGKTNEEVVDSKAFAEHVEQVKAVPLDPEILSKLMEEQKKEESK